MLSNSDRKTVEMVLSMTETQLSAFIKKLPLGAQSYLDTLLEAYDQEVMDG